MLTVSKLARLCGLSRTTVLYYESLGLLKPARRGSGNYRVYGEKELGQLRQICAYRDAGLKLDDIRIVLGRPESDVSAVLRRRLLELDDEIRAKRSHRNAIALLLGSTEFEKEKDMTKEKWTSIMSAAGLTAEDMHRWHAEFERSAPEDHRQFLEYLHLAEPEIVRIREWSRSACR
jgi:DNA-binding transcriptional MerR regulator